MIRNGEVKFWTPVNFEVDYLLNEETDGVLTDTVSRGYFERSYNFERCSMCPYNRELRCNGRTNPVNLFFFR